MPRKRSALATPCSVIETVLCFSSISKSKSARNCFFDARVHAFGRLARLHLRRQARELDVQVGGLFGRAGDDQRRARLVDQDVVDLVDDREGVPALDLFAEVLGHVVAQVVEAELGVGAVDDVAGVRALLLLVGLHVLQHADGDAERVVDRAHPFRVALRQVVVDGHQVHALALGRARPPSRRRAPRASSARPRASPSASCPRRSSSPRSGRRAAPSRRSAARRSGACPSCACRSRARSQSTPAAARRATRPRARARAARPSARAARRRCRVRARPRTRRSARRASGRSCTSSPRRRSARDRAGRACAKDSSRRAGGQPQGLIAPAAAASAQPAALMCAVRLRRTRDSRPA